MSSISTASTIESSDRNGVVRPSDRNDYFNTIKQCKDSNCNESVFHHETHSCDPCNVLMGNKTTSRDLCQQTKSKSKPWPSFSLFTSVKQVRFDLLSGSFSSCAASKTEQNSNESAAEVKRKWRHKQISLLRTLNCSINSSWRKRQITALWSGWLEKRSSGIVRLWQARWFELRQEPISQGDGSGLGHHAVLQYTGRGIDGCEMVKRLEIIDARRDCQHDGAGRACLSVGVAGRGGRVLLRAGSDSEAASLLSCIAFIVRSPPMRQVE
jgi:hypothetical protein